MSRRPFVLFWAESVCMDGMRMYCMYAAAELRPGGETLAQRVRYAGARGNTVQYRTMVQSVREREGRWMCEWMDGWMVQSWVVQRM